MAGRKIKKYRRNTICSARLCEIAHCGRIVCKRNRCCGRGGAPHRINHEFIRNGIALRNRDLNLGVRLPVGKANKVANFLDGYS